MNAKIMNIDKNDFKQTILDLLTDYDNDVVKACFIGLKVDKSKFKDEIDKEIYEDLNEFMFTSWFDDDFGLSTLGLIEVLKERVKNSLIDNED